MKKSIAMANFSVSVVNQTISTTPRYRNGLFENTKTEILKK
ncbi:hypothetical protein [Peribacillus butanolivorans]|nr:hypothetical protein [Peribacillus butanolivorans]